MQIRSSFGKLGIQIVLFVAGLASAAVFTVSRASLRPELAADARATYNAKCAVCHGRDGRGRTARGRRKHSRDLTDAGWQNDVTDERLYNSIRNGKGKMPAFKKSLNDNQVDELVSYVRRLRR